MSLAFGLKRGLPVDRYYVEQFLTAHASDIRGVVLEIGDPAYTRKFGGGRVTRSEVLHPSEGNPEATIVADLASAGHVPSDLFDCVILTQTLQFIYDTKSTLATLHRILRPSGVLLATTSGISQISRWDQERWGHYWNFTSSSVRHLFEGAFPGSTLTIQAYGNVLAAVSFLHGIAAGELRPEELDYCDPDYEVLIAVRAVKPSERAR